MSNFNFKYRAKIVLTADGAGNGEIKIMKSSYNGMYIIIKEKLHWNF